MAQAPAMPLFTDALLGDTQHLSLEEFGAYVKLLIIDWRQKPAQIPDDDCRVARMLGIPVRRWRVMKNTICDGKLYRIERRKFRQKRLEKEWAYVKEKTVKNRANALRGVAAKSLKKRNTESANGTAKKERPVKPNDPVRTTERLSTHSYSSSKLAVAESSTQPRATSLEVEVRVEVLRLLTEADSSWETRDASLVRQWLADGCDPETHIYPIIRQKAANGGASVAHSLRYFTEAIHELRDGRPVAGPDPVAETARGKALALAKARSDEAFEDRLAAVWADPAVADRIGEKYLSDHPAGAHGEAQEA